MRKAFIAVLIWLVSLTVLAQKVSVKVTKTKNIAESEWQIRDENQVTVFSGVEYSGSDSVRFSLEANKRYFLDISVSGIYDPDTVMYCLFIKNEPVLLISSGLLPGDHSFGFFTGVREDQTKITGGLNADISDFPWQVFYESGNFTCGGSIISGDWVITAAHCTEDDNGIPIPVSTMDVIVGANNPRIALEGKKYFVSRVIVHDKYDRITHNYDIALLKLQAVINYTNATPIRLISKIDSAAGATDPGVMSWVTGYGLIKAIPETYPTQLQKVQLPIVTNAQASVIWPDIAPTDMMAGFHSGNKDACNGDSGGPLVVPVGSEYKLAGLVSWGSSTCDTYGAYTRVSLFESWISSNTGIEISFVPPVPAGDSIICKGVASSVYNVGSIAGATAYEWQLLPAVAGTISGNLGQATITWGVGYTGAATVRLRVTKNNVVSYWSALTVHIADYNKLISKSNDTIICAQKPLNINVVADGYNLKYFWYQDNNLLKSGPSPEISFSSTAVSNSGLYRCDITGSCGLPLSTEINLTVLPVTKITGLTPDSAASFGENITLTVDAEGHNLNYQWRKDGNELAQATGQDLLLRNINASNTGLYQVNVTGTCGIVLSNNIYLFVRGKGNSDSPEIMVWPTVFSNEFSVALSDEQFYNLLLFSTTGRLLLEKQNCQFRTTLNLSDIPGGVYILTVYNNKFRKSVKVIKD